MSGVDVQGQAVVAVQHVSPRVVERVAGQCPGRRRELGRIGSLHVHFLFPRAASIGVHACAFQEGNLKRDSSFRSNWKLKNSHASGDQSNTEEHASVLASHMYIYSSRCNTPAYRFGSLARTVSVKKVGF